MKNITAALIASLTIASLTGMDQSVQPFHHFHDEEETFGRRPDIQASEYLKVMRQAGGGHKHIPSAITPLTPGVFMNDYLRKNFEPLSNDAKRSAAGSIAYASQEMPWKEARLYLAAVAEFLPVDVFPLAFFHNDHLLVQRLFEQNKKPVDQLDSPFSQVRSVAVAAILQQRGFAPQPTVVKAVLEEGYEPALIPHYFPGTASVELQRIAASSLHEALVKWRNSLHKTRLVEKARLLKVCGAVTNENSQAAQKYVQENINNILKHKDSPMWVDLTGETDREYAALEQLSTILKQES